MESLACTFALVSLGGMVKYFDGRITHGVALLPSEDYFNFLGLILAVLYLNLALIFTDLASPFDMPAVGLTASWIGLSWYLIACHLKSPEAPEHILEWTGNHLLLTACFLGLLGIKAFLI